MHKRSILNSFNKVNILTFRKGSFMLLLKLYRKVIGLLTPVVRLYLNRRLKNGLEDYARFRERLGRNSLPRPEGKLIWMHGASVGECLSMLPLIKKIVQEDKDLHIMVTSGTVTSASILTKRLPERTFHQYYPVDCPRYVRRFIRHWKPDVAFFFESEFWPCMLYEIQRNEIPLVLLNGRVSDKAFKTWQRHKFLSKTLQKMFTLSFGQTEEDTRRLKVLGAPNTDCVGNLKYAQNPLKFNEEELKKLQEKIGVRPTFLMASTHSNEEEMGGKIHKELKKKYPNLLTIITPRHINRRDEILNVLEKNGLEVAVRSKGEELKDTTDIYLADTMGELTMFYKLALAIFVGGSLIPFGGQNMLEPMREGAYVMVGPHAFNFREIVSEGTKAGALKIVSDPKDLEKNVEKVFSKESGVEEQGRKAEALTKQWEGVIDRLYPRIKKWL
ncbi:MAG: 3-deoxy-D-manno-octulosonic acid transferase [Alphaproteobacteria bacterium]|nr:3-deoxy-D-manno-octulosonic acid transferase [Alphaproteobacteria bacterium]